MARFARRSLRTTAAAAGIAAVGVGFAGHALAAPAAPAPPGTGDLGTPSMPAAPDAAAPNLVGDMPSAPSTELGDLPPIFTFEGPTVYTAGDEPELPSPSSVPSASDADTPAIATTRVLDTAGTGGLSELPELRGPDLESVQGAGEGNNIEF